MTPRLPPALALSALLLLGGAASNAQAPDPDVLHAGDTALRIELVDVADPGRAALLQHWVGETADAVLTVGGRFPLRDAVVRVKQIDSDDDSPVPWGQTQRDDGVAVLLFVRRDATLAQLRDDWTAVHELSHMFHPWLGAKGRWLSEGLASYYQNVLRARVGAIDAEDAWRQLDGGFQRGRKAGRGARLDQLRVRRDETMRLYWAGAAYWLEADLALRREHDSSLDAVLAEYARCCLQGTTLVAPADFVAQLDRIAGADVFTSRYRRFAAAEVFPPIDATYRTLGIVAGDGPLRFSQGDAAAQLRDAITDRRPPREPVVDVGR